MADVLVPEDTVRCSDHQDGAGTRAPTFHSVFHPHFPHSNCRQDSRRGKYVFMRGLGALVLEGGIQTL